jgi:DNA mismatch repair protein MutS
MTTPMMKQYLAAKRKAGDAVLFFRMGDFYELFYDDAKLASRLLGLALTSRSKGEGAVPMAGFPHRSVSTYVRKLLSLDHKVAICEQIQDPRKAKGLVDRDVVRVITPGTLTEDEVLSPKDENHLAAVVRHRGGAGLAWVDLSTGRFRVEETGPGGLDGEFQRLSPSEVLLPEGGGEEMSDAAVQALVPSPCMITRRPDWTFDPGEGLALLRRHFGVQTLAGFGLDDGAPYVGAAGAVLHYLNETQKTALGHIAKIELVRISDYMLLDGPTRRSLELTRSSSGSREGTLLAVLDHTRTAMGARLLKEWILHPLLKAGDVVQRQQGVAEMVENPGMLEDLAEAIEEIHDIERIAARVACGRAGPRDMVALGNSLARLPVLRDAAGPADSPLLRAAREMETFDDLADLLARALEPSPPVALREGGIIRPGYDRGLDDLRDVARQGKGWIARFQAEELARTGIPSLKIGYNKVFGYYIEVTNTHRDKVPAHYTRKQTLKNAERYITDDLKEHEVRVLTADEKSKDLEYDLFLALREACAAYVPRLQAVARIVAAVDVLASLARAAVRGRYRRPTLVEERNLSITEGRHPVLETLMDPGTFVPNDVEMDAASRLLVITGPNMAGKSTTIRQVALLVLMAQIGSFVPAKEARIGVADRIFTRTGASDEISRGLSTFLVEMNETANILNNATERSIVILDEVGRGTSTFDGVSIAWAVAEDLATRVRARTLFATHYHELTELALVHPEVRNFHVSVKEWGDRLVFVHKLSEGGVDRSYGIHVAQIAGIPRDVIDRAQGILERLEGQSVDTDLRPAFAPETGSRTDSVQLSLFSAPPSPVVEALRSLDLDNLTPLEALVKLRDLKQKAQEDGS